MMLGDYELTHLLGEGGMAQLYLATERGREGLVRRVVIKRILPELTDDPIYTRMLIDEARVDALVQHPNVVQLYALEQASGAHFLVLEWVDGMDAHKLAQVLHPEKPRLPRQIALFITLEMLQGVHAAHVACGLDGQPLNIVHRDLSPSNVLLSRAGAVKVSDFGIAKWHAQTTRTRTGELKGKFMYMSPEQASARKVDARSDVYAAALLLFEWLTGERANKGMGTSGALADAREGKLDLTPLDAQPADVAQVIRRALEKAPGDRFESAEAFAKALRQTQTARLGVAHREELAALVSTHAQMPPLLTTDTAWEEAGPSDRTPALAGSQDTEPSPTPASVVSGPARTEEARMGAPAVWALPVGVAVLALTGVMAWRGFVDTAPAATTPSVVAPASAPSPAPTPATPAIPEIPQIGFLSVNSMPWGVVYVDGTRLKGNTPIVRHRLAAGAHVIKIESPGLQRSRELRVEIQPGEHVSRVIDFSR
jgi:serine/threonine protein kinase